jgi:hypothetical protein
VCRCLTLLSAVLVVIAALAASGCGGDDHSRRDAVDQYIREINTIQARLRSPLAAVAIATRSFSTRPAELRSERVRLARAEQTIVRLQRRIDKLEAPQDARTLHRRLVTLLRAERGLTHELLRVAVVQPELDDATRAVGPAGKAFQAELAAAKTGREQAAALDRYGAKLARPIEKLRAVHPPPLLEPVRDAQLATLTRLRSTGRSLAAALRKRQARQAGQLVQRFQAAARTGDTVAAQRARIAAVKAYNVRVARVSRLAALVQRERDRLDRKLP